MSLPPGPVPQAPDAPLFPVPGLGPLRQAGPPLGRTAVATLVLLNVVVILRILDDVTPPWWVSMLAALGVFVSPLRLVSWKVGWQTTSRAEQIVYSFATVLLALMVGGLALNTVLPWVGVARPLDPAPVLISFDLAMVGLVTWRRDRVPPPARVLTTWVPYSPRDVGVIVVALLALLLVCLGAVRLNNGAGGEVSLVGLVCIALDWAILLRDRYRLRSGPVHLSLYILGLALLLMTSLRGWLTTGHDIQKEYRLFRLVLDHGVWDMAAYRDAYNACTSITILPTLVHNLTGLDPIYVMKVIPSLVFATCPVMVYLISQRFVTRGPALLGVLVFMAFPTYFSDMPFLTRQEYAFTFLGVGLLAVTNLRFSVRRRRVTFGVFAAGVLLSHYSTTYVLIGMLLLGLTVHYAIKWLGRGLPQRLSWLRRHRPAGGARTRDVRFVIGVTNLVVLVGMTLFWTQVVTGTTGHLVETLTGTVVELLHPGTQDSRSSDTGYTLFGGNKVTADERIAQYRVEQVDLLASERSRRVFLPLASVDGAATPALDAVALPKTRLGLALDRVGIDVQTVNGLVRSVAARLLQVFVVVGMIAVLLGYRRKWVNASPELTLLAGSSFVIVLTQVVLPQLSLEYGVLRAFQQSLFLLAPFLAIGMLVTLAPLRRAASATAGVLGLLFLLSLTGVVPQLTGGYPAQLHLNDVGEYYDIYYTRPPEVAAADWMLARVHAEGWSDEDNVQTDRFSYSRIQSFTRIDTGSDIFPVQLRAKAYTLLTAATVQQRRASLAVQGDVITYRYPVALLASMKDLVYSNGDASVYR